MEQLTQMELLQLHQLMALETLAAKKCRIYAHQADDRELQTWFEEAALEHQERFAGLLDQMRAHNGRGERGLLTEH